MKIVKDLEGRHVMRHPDGATGIITSVNEDSQMVWIMFDELLDDDVVRADDFFGRYTVLSER